MFIETAKTPKSNIVDSTVFSYHVKVHESSDRNILKGLFGSSLYKRTTALVSKAAAAQMPHVISGQASDKVVER